MQGCAERMCFWLGWLDNHITDLQCHPANSLRPLPSASLLLRRPYMWHGLNRFRAVLPGQSKHKGSRRYFETPKCCKAYPRSPSIQAAQVYLHQPPGHDEIGIAHWWIMVGPDGLDFGFSTVLAHYYVKVMLSQIVSPPVYLLADTLWGHYPGAARFLCCPPCRRCTCCQAVRGMLPCVFRSSSNVLCTSSLMFK
jgi:hypothetical protein